MPDPTEQHLHHLFATLNSLARSYQNNGADEASLLSLAKKIQADPVALGFACCFLVRLFCSLEQRLCARFYSYSAQVA